MTGLPARLAARWRLRRALRPRRIRGGRLRRVRRVLVQPGGERCGLRLQLRDARQRRLQQRLQLGDARVASIQLWHRERRSRSSRSVDPLAQGIELMGLLGVNGYKAPCRRSRPNFSRSGSRIPVRLLGIPAGIPGIILGRAPVPRVLATLSSEYPRSRSNQRSHRRDGNTGPARSTRRGLCPSRPGHDRLHRVLGQRQDARPGSRFCKPEAEQ